MTNYEYIKTLNEEEFAEWLGVKLASVVLRDDTDFNDWVLFREKYKELARSWCKQEHKTENSYEERKQ